MGSIPFSPASSGLTVRVVVFLSHLSVTESSSSQPYLEIQFLVLFCFRDLPRTLRSFLSRSHGTDISTHLCSIPHLGVDPSRGPPPPTRQSSNANMQIRTSGVPLAERLQNQLCQQDRWETRFLASKARSWWDSVPVLLYWE